MDPADAVRIGVATAAKVCPRGPWVDDVAGAAIEAAWLHPDIAPIAAYRAAVDELRRLTKVRRYGTPTRTNQSRWVDSVGSIDAVVDQRNPDYRTVADRIGADDPEPLVLDRGLHPQLAELAVLLSLGFTKTEAADLLGITPGAVTFRLRRLRRHLGGTCDEAA